MCINTKKSNIVLPRYFAKLWNVLKLKIEVLEISDTDIELLFGSDKPLCSYCFTIYEKAICRQIQTIFFNKPKSLKTG